MRVFDSLAQHQAMRSTIIPDDVRYIVTRLVPFGSRVLCLRKNLARLVECIELNQLEILMMTLNNGTDTT